MYNLFIYYSVMTEVLQLSKFLLFQLLFLFSSFIDLDVCLPLLVFGSVRQRVQIHSVFKLRGVASWPRKRKKHAPLRGIKTPNIFISGDRSSVEDFFFLKKNRMVFHSRPVQLVQRGLENTLLSVGYHQEVALGFYPTNMYV